MIPNKKEERLAYFSALYEAARTARASEEEKLRRHMEQYLGSDEIDGSTVRATAVRNITYEIVEGELSAEIPAPRVSACRFGEQGERNAATVEHLCNRSRDELPFERLNDMDERYTAIYGGSVWLVEWDAAEASDGRSGIRVHCLSPLDFIPQPDMPEVEDMEYCFLRQATPRRELPRRFGITAASAEDARAEADGGFTEEDTVTVITCFYREEDGRVSRFVFSGDCVLSDLADYYGRKIPVCTVCGAPKGGCACGAETEYRAAEFEEVALPGGEGEAIGICRVEYYRPRHFPVVIRKNISREGSWIGQSDCEMIRPQQQQINKLESRIQAKLMRSAVTPVMPEDARLSPDNSVFGQVVRLQPGENAGMYGVIDTTPNVSQEMTQSDRLYEQARRIVGISDSYVGLADHSALSGYAKKLQVEQAAGRLESKRRMKEAAYADIDRLIFEFTLAYADEAKSIAYRDAYGRLHESLFDRYDFLLYDRTRDRWLYDDGYLFSADKNGSVLQQRESLWERNLENLRSGSLGDAGNPMTLLRYWQNQERAHYPYARENVEYFADVLKQREETVYEVPCEQ